MEETTTVGHSLSILPKGFNEMTPSEREHILKNMCDHVAEGTYTKPFSPEERVQAAEDVANKVAELAQKQEEYGELKATFKTQIKGLKEDLVNLSENQQAGGYILTGTVYTFIEKTDVGINAVTIDPMGRVLNIAPAKGRLLQKSLLNNI